MNVLKTPEKKTIKLGDKDYRLSPLNLNVMADIEEGFGCSLLSLGEELEKRQATVLRRLIHILLKDQYPKMTLTKVGELIDLSNLDAVNEVLGKILSGD